MRKAIFSGIVALGVGVSGAVAAADMPMPGSKAQPVTLAAYNWSGFYLGGNAGYGWAQQDTALVGAGAAFSNTIKSQGVIGGGQVGFNWQNGAVVWGLEADIQASQSGDLKATGTIGGLAATETVSQRIDWFGTVRARVGYANGRWLPYVTAGWVYGHGKETVTVAVTGFPSTTGSSSANTTNGWTVGGGLEAALSGNWTGKVEYLYIDFGSDSGASTAGFTAGNTTDHVVRVGLNYRL